VIVGSVRLFDALVGPNGVTKFRLRDVPPAKRRTETFFGSTSGPRGGSDPRRVTGHLVRSDGHRARGARVRPALSFRQGTGMSLTECKSRQAGVMLALAALAAACLAATSSPASSGEQWQQVIVSGTSGALTTVEHDVTSTGGHVRKVLSVVNGVSARVPASSIPRLRQMPGVRAVTPDATGHLMGIDPTLGYDVQNDEGSLYDVAQVTHAKDAWKSKYTGQGVGVALIDSGIAPVQGLTSGNVVDGPDLSFESQVPQLAHLDTYGHGTHMASIIVGRDVQMAADKYASSDSHHFNGIAPDARLISLKVAANNGAVDVSQVIAAIDWVVQHRNDPSFNIKVLNLSYGTDSKQSPAVDPLDYAVENAWRAGITVVVAAGNDGTNRQELADPANDPLVLAVGADDPMNSDSVGDDQVPAFSQRGNAGRHVDLIAPGVHILGLRDPGSFIDQNNPGAVVNDRFFRGSGTSQSAAVVSGLAALYLSKYPTATPDQVKRALMMTATVPSSVKATYAGLGVPDVNKALGQKPMAYTQPATAATGTGSLEAARGSFHVNDGTTDLTGEQDIFGHTWTGSDWAALSALGATWSGGDWNGSTWSGSTWSGSTWSGATWSGATWSGATWSGATWSGATWSGATWSGATWSGATWSGATWSGATWSGATWSGATWSGATWSGATWSGATWSGASWS
jgi:serine protease AprX